MDKISNKNIELITQFRSIIFAYKTHKDKNNKKIIHIFDYYDSLHLFEINKIDSSVLVSKEFIWDLFKDKYSLTDKEIQLFLNEMVSTYLGYKDFVCNRMIF